MPWTLVLVQVPGEPSRHRVAVWRELRRIGAVPIGSGAWLLPAVEPFVEALDRVGALVERGAGSFAVLSAGPRDIAAEEVLRTAFAKVRVDEWLEFVDDCGKFEAEIDKEFAKEKFTLAELEEEEQSLERLRRWFATLASRDVLRLPEAGVGADRLAACEQRLNEYADEVYERVSSAPGGPDSDI
ncbi:MAG: chromate resistance protein ChrB [Acidobacteria bacterium]|nr:chromate resistance protein ChrB [Acidobacteriota bacterium]